MSPTELLQTPVISILLVAMLVSLAVAVANRLLIDQEKMRAWRRELTEWRSELERARRLGDKKLLSKLKKRERKIMQIQSKMFMQSVKIWPISMIIYLVAWYLFLVPTYQNVPVVATLPGINGEFQMPMFIWYMLCSFLFGTLFTRILGIVVES